ncbi:MAG: sugar phosphate nucleotidyltransferase [Candidatus Pacebacteria bacterium]|nr:sugar phosphate nucleotidyltransferase [Candidatus Paceibacterota bacterium]
MDEVRSHHYAVILAGGSGTRLWPLSRHNTPKQFIPFLNGQSTFRHVHDLLIDTFPPGHIFYSVTEEFADRVRAELPQVPTEQIIVEPEGRDTGAAMCLIASTLARRDPEAVAVVVGADHVIDTPTAFKNALRDALDAAEHHRDEMVLVGTKPLRPHTGLGYIRLGDPVDTEKESELFVVADFEEKPTSDVAEGYLRRGKHVWNTGYKAFKCSTFLKRVESIAPHIHNACALVSASHPAVTEEARTAFSAIEKKSFEYLFGTSLPFLVLRTEVVWHDIGDWKTVHGLKAKEDTADRTVLIDSHNSVVVGGMRVVAVYGVEDIVVVDTEDALLIVDRNHARNIKSVVDELKKRGLHGYL